MACEDRQLTEAQRVAGYQNQRTGVPQALRPFGGRPTLDNLLDYINRELVPAVRRTRDAVNDIYLPAVDNAPSANPLIYYFSAETGNADPTAGRIRLDASPENTATTIRVSETNARLADARPWLEVMAGGATSPLGVVTLSDAINPARFIRFDLDTMVDQGTYWDLGVTVIESSHDDPFAEGGGLVVSFIPGVASEGATVPAGALSPIGANTVIGNPTASTAAPTEIALAENSVLGRAGAAGTGNIEAITVPGTGTLTGESVFLQSSSLRNHVRWSNWTLSAMPLMSDNRFVGNISGATARPAYVDLGSLSSVSVLYENVGKTFIREALSGDVVALQNSNSTTIQPNVVDNTKAADMAAGTVKGRQIDAGTGDPVDLVGSEVGEIIRFANITTEATGGTLDNVALDMLTDQWRFTATATVNGIAGGTEGKEIVIENASSAGSGVTVTIGHFATSSTIGNRFILPDNVALLLLPSSCARFRYIATRWRCIGVTGTVASLRDGDKGDITVSSSGTVWTVDNDAISNAKAANMAQSTLKGRAEGAGTGDPQDLTPAQAAAIIDGEAITWSALQSFAGGVAYSAAIQTETAAATMDITLAAGTVRLLIESSGTDFSVNSISGAATAGRLVILEHTRLSGSANGTVVHASGTAPSNSAINCPDSANLTLHQRHAVILVSRSGVWRVVARAGIGDATVTLAKMANLAAGTVIGRQIDAGTGVPVALVGSEIAEIIRWANITTEATGGTFSNHALDTLTDVWSFTATSTITGVSGGTAGRLLRIYNAAAAGSGVTVTINQFDGASLSGNRFLNRDASNIILDPGGAATYYYESSRWRLYGLIGASAVSDADKGDITVSSAGKTWTIDNNVVSDAKLRDSAACSVIGRSANSSGDPADISASANDRLLARTSNTVAFQQLTDGMVPTNTVGLTKLANILDNRVLGNVSGATGSVTAIDLGSFNSTSITYESTGKTFIREALSGDVVALQNNNSTTIQPNVVDNAKLADMAQSRIKGRAEGAGTGDPTDLTPAQVVSIIDGEAVTWTGTHAFNGTGLTASTSSDITLASGGTTTLSATTQVQITSPTRLASSIAFDSVGTTSATAANDLVINSVSVVRFTGPVDPLTGMVAAVAGQTVLLVNTHASTNMGIHIESASSSAANRFAGTGTSRTIRPGEMALAWYDGSSSRWRLLCRDEADL